MYPNTISIDFGASSTKVAFRSECLPVSMGEHTHNARMFAVDSSILIPTLAIETGRSDQPWFFGQAAEELTPTEEMKVHRNWKAGLLRRDNGPETVRSTIVAHYFFRWLREELMAARTLPLNPSVRILLPAFDDFEALKNVVLECMKSAGWNENIEFGNEPHANALGILTEGRNVYRKGNRSESVDFGQTYGMHNPYIRAGRNAVLHSGSKNTYRIAIVDIGAFTTDIALLGFNVVDSDSDGLFDRIQESIPVGAYQGIEVPLFQHLHKRHGIDHELISGSLRDEIKKAVLAGNTYNYLGKDLGDKIDQDAISIILKNLIDTIWSHIGSAIKRNPLNATYLTGGAANIPRVSQLLGEHLPRLQVVGHPDGKNQLKLSSTYIIDWRTDGDVGLRRIATALGGCSFLHSNHLASPAEEIDEPKARRKSEHPCTCQGMNPDCAICSGSGYV